MGEMPTRDDEIQIRNIGSIKPVERTAWPWEKAKDPKLKLCPAGAHPPPPNSASDGRGPADEAPTAAQDTHGRAVQVP